MALIKNGVVQSGSGGGGGDATAANQTTIITDTNELQTDWTNGGRLDLIVDELTTQGDTNESKIDTVDTVVDGIETKVGRVRETLTYWSVMQEEVAITNVAGDKSLPDVTVSGIPSGATIVKAIALFKFWAVENTNGSANKLNGAQEIQVRDDSPSAWTDAINFVDDAYGLAASTREGGDIVVGVIDVSGTVDGNDTYNFQWDEAVADLDGIKFNNVQVGLEITYSI